MSVDGFKRRQNVRQTYDVLRTSFDGLAISPAFATMRCSALRHCNDFGHGPVALATAGVTDRLTTPDAPPREFAPILTRATPLLPVAHDYSRIGNPSRVPPGLNRRVFSLDRGRPFFLKPASQFAAIADKAKRLRIGRKQPPQIDALLQWSR